MPRKRELDIVDRSKVVLLYSQGQSQSKIAKTIKRSRYAIQMAIKRFQETGSYENRKKSGRKRKTTRRDDRFLTRLSLKNRMKSSKDLAAELNEQQGISISARTVRRRLVQANLHGRKARRKPLLTEEQMKKTIIVFGRKNTQIGQ
ncbi:transposable element-related [Holotrichia oblita]|uniref:Transposable element-related n=1 Tax=Holotrichia oblita TaxID=644536 RepID=A0ACB9SKX6_HOLOL|nr:transposable element-related [Holotrichia oblita]